MSSVAISGLGVRFGSLEVLRDLSLNVADGEFVSILGPSGCGKSTTFSVLTGAVPSHAGSMSVDERPVARDDFAFMPQKDALFPWRRIIDNLTLGLEVAGTKRPAARSKVTPLLEPFGLDGFERSYPFQLSGGMRQRAALLRTVVQDRGVLLLDEPFGALDALTRAKMQRWVSHMWERYRWTVLLVTHDVREAVYLSDRIYVFSARPATVVDSVPVGLPRPRDFGSPEFAALEKRLLDLLIGEDSGADIAV
ncbi:MAG: ABC transporter ATP-binding protein [Streptosporangiaceae bacterium]|jgi:ABC-type nitrate/sulfonate/bicarbonate transport system ATPase subunit